MSNIDVSPRSDPFLLHRHRSSIISECFSQHPSLASELHRMIPSEEPSSSNVEDVAMCPSAYG